MENGGSRSILTDAFVIAAIPAFIYALSYQFEAGYLRSFGIPSYFVSINLSSIAYAITFSIGIVVLVFLLLDLASYLLPQSVRENIRYFYPLIFWLIIILVDVAVSPTPIRRLLYHLTPLWLIFAYYLLPLVTGKGSGIQRIKDSWHADSEFQQGRTLKWWLFENVNWHLFISVTLVAIYLPLTMEKVGRRLGGLESRFWSFTEANDKYAIVSVYGASILAKRIESNGRLASSFQVFPLLERGELTRVTVDRSSSPVIPQEVAPASN
jgi:hypothetical protein